MSNQLRIEHETDPVLRQATEWALELSDARTPVERVTQWQNWMSADRRHRQAFERVEELMGSMDAVRAVPWPENSELAADRYDGAVSVSKWKADNCPSRRDSRRIAIPFAIAAAILVAVATLFGIFAQELSVPGWVTYKRMETPAGGTLKALLADGSAVDVGGRSSLRSVITSQARTITLEDGEAFFRVAQDAARPFTVNAGTTSITAIGTAFNVRRSGERVVVSVAEGAVKVDVQDRAGSSGRRPEMLTAGQQLAIEPRDATLTVATIDAGAVAGWRDGRLRYLNEPLANVIGDVARYTGQEIALAEPSIGELRITGTVLEHNLNGWLGSLEETFPVRASRLPNGAVRLERRD